MLLCTKSSILAEQLGNLQGEEVESILCKIGKGQEAFNLGDISQNPWKSKDSDKKKLFNKIKMLSKSNSCIIGDLNFHGINWLTMEADNNGTDFRGTYLDAFLYQHVDEPTRCNNILDLAVSKREESIDNVQVVGPLENSDHNVVKFEFLSSNFSSSSPTFYNFNKGDFNSIRRNYLVKFGRGGLLINKEDPWIYFSNKVTLLTDKYVPRKVITNQLIILLATLTI